MQKPSVLEGFLFWGCWLFVIPKDVEDERGHERQRTGEAISCEAGKLTRNKIIILNY